jgi:hypothetical protein
MTRRVDAGFAERFGNAHEDGNPTQEAAERQMDLHNNRWGRTVATAGSGHPDRWMADRCAGYAEDGTLRTLAP